MINVALILIFLFSAFNLAQALTQCPTCKGAKVLKCPRCDLYTLGKPKPACIVCGGTGSIDCPDCIYIPIDTGNGVPTNGDPFDGGQRQDTNISFPIDWPILGVGIVTAVVVGAFVFVKQKKVSESHLSDVSLNEFQNWVVKRFSGKNVSQRESNIGIDGYTVEGIPILIKQSENVGANVIDSFASVIGRQNARNGVVVAFSFSDDIYRGIVRAKRNYRIEIKKVTVKELIARKQM